MVYINDEKKFKSLNLGEFDITPDAEGRRNSVAIIPLKSEEVIISQAVVETVTKEKVTFEELGGAMAHSTKSGVCQMIRDDEKSILAATRKPTRVGIFDLIKPVTTVA